MKTKKIGGKRIGAGRKHAPIKTKTKQIRGISILMFNQLQLIDNKLFKDKTIELWQSLIDKNMIKII